MILSGVLYNAGGPVRLAKIMFIATKTSLNGVLRGAYREFITQEDGTYFLDLEPGYYRVEWYPSKGPVVRLGTVTADDATMATLPEALRADGQPVNPDIVKDEVQYALDQIQTLRDEAEVFANDAAESAASVDAQNIVHAPGSGLENEAGTAYSYAVGSGSQQLPRNADLGALSRFDALSDAEVGDIDELRQNLGVEGEGAIASVGYVDEGLQQRVAVGAVGAEEITTSTGTQTVVEALDDRYPVVNVKNYGAAGDGITNDQAAIESAIAQSLIVDLPVLWPPGTYLSDSNIPNLHSVSHTGRGVIIRENDTFAPSPASGSLQENTLYVATSGDNNNDGLTDSLPLLTPQHAVDILSKYSPLNSGIWIINFADGVYIGSWDLSVFSKNPIRLIGSEWISEPSVIFDGEGTRNRTLRIHNNSNVEIKNLHFTNCLDNVVEVLSGSTASIRDSWYTEGGLSIASGACLYGFEKARLFINGRCKIDGCYSSEGALTLYDSSTASIGQDGSGEENSPKISNARRGIQARNQSLAKGRYAYIEDCVDAWDTREGSRISHENGAIRRASVAYYQYSPSSQLINQDVIEYTGVRSLRYATSTSGVQDRPIQRDSVNFRRVRLYSSSELDNSTISGTTFQTNILNSAFSLLNQDFNIKGRAFKVVMYGQKTGSAGSLVVGLSASLGGNIRNLVANRGELGFFRAEISFTCMTNNAGSNEGLAEAVIIFDEFSPQYVQSITNKNLSATQDIALHVLLSDSSDSVTFNAVEVFQAGI